VVRFWDVATGKETSSFHLPGQLTAFALSPDGKTLAVDTADEENAIRFLRVPDGKVLRRMEDLYSYSFDGLCFSPDGKWLAGAGDHGRFHVWNAADGKEVLRGTEGGERDMCCLPIGDGQQKDPICLSPDHPFFGYSPVTVHPAKLGQLRRAAFVSTPADSANLASRVIVRGLTLNSSTSRRDVFCAAVSPHLVGIISPLHTG
jgi:hypothetical protein